MLAYVFFHRLAPGADATVYEDALRRFHAALAATPPSGFLRSVTFRVDGGYADWYLVEGSAALDGLNDAAVSGAAKAGHDAAAGMAVDGAGKLLALVSGEPRFAPGVEVRFSKPPGTSYTDFYAQLAPWTARPDVSLWRRMMVLGPAPEFCFISQADLDLPAVMSPVSFHRTPV